VGARWPQLTMLGSAALASFGQGLRGQIATFAVFERPAGISVGFEWVCF